MSAASERAKGMVEELGGKIKKTIGHVIGNQQMEVEGKAQELHGEAKQAAVKAGERLKDKVGAAADAVKKRVGR